MVSSIDDEQLVRVGKVTKVHGIKGEIKVFPFSEVPGDLTTCATLTLQRKGSEPVCCKVNNCRVHGKFAIVSLQGVSNRNHAETFIGMEVLVDKDCLPELESDEYYWHEMIGIAVVTDDGRKLGKVTQILETGARDVLVVTGTGHEYLIPVLDDIIVSIDHDNSLLTITPLPGLLEINQAEDAV